MNDLQVANIDGGLSDADIGYKQVYEVGRSPSRYSPVWGVGDGILKQEQNTEGSLSVIDSIWDFEKNSLDRRASNRENVIRPQCILYVATGGWSL